MRICPNCGHKDPAHIAADKRHKAKLRRIRARRSNRKRSQR